MTEFTKIGMAGDWHNNTLWAVSAIDQMCEKLSDQPYPVIVQLGDFGLWSKKDHYQQQIAAALVKNNAVLFFLDGNHENHPLLKSYQNSQLRRTTAAIKRGTFLTENYPGIPGSVKIAPSLYWLPRGVRWGWHNRIWLACGGAVSVDANMRREGFDWFPEEEISNTQKHAIIAGGRADVMLTHDCPDFNHPYDESNPYGFSWQLLNKSRDHARLLQEIVDAVQPSHLYHGHYHTAYGRTMLRDWGTINLNGLHCDGSRWNWEILDIEKMRWVDE